MKIKKSQPEAGAIQALVLKGKKKPFPAPFMPMLASRAEAVFDDEDWVYEIKWDGYRAVSYLRKGVTEIRSRNLLPFDQKFPAVHAALEEWEVNAVVDGEIIAVNADNTANFQQLQNYAAKGRKVHLQYYLFDIVWYDGRDLSSLSLLERKTILEHIIPAGHPVIKYSDHISGKGKLFFKKALKQGLEGIMAKRKDSGYVTGYRTQNWLKIKNARHMEAIICGFTEPRRSRRHIGAVILGRYEGDKLVYIGHSGSGLTEQGLKSLYEKLKKIVVKQCPFDEVPKTNMPVTWVKPLLVCEIKFSEWTEDGSLRHPIFAGLREDKTAAGEKNEVIIPVSRVAKKNNLIMQKTATTKSKTSGLPSWLPAGEEETAVTVNRHSLTFTHLDKLYWPKDKITKRDLLNYYHAIAPFILPYMKDRPQSLNRHPNGIDKPGFYQKNMDPKMPSWLSSYEYFSESDEKKIHFLVCKDEASLLYMASLGCIEMNPWHSRVQSAGQPDWCLIDLDPDGNSFDKVIETANTVKQLLDSIKVPACCKTSGATGMHICIPLGAKYSYDQSRMFAQLVVTHVHEQLSSFTSLERAPAKRKGKIYLDYLQNRSIQTMAAPYSVRPRPGATVSTPLHWEELKKGLTPQQFTMFNILERLKKEGDLFAPVLKKGINMEKALTALQGNVKM